MTSAKRSKQEKQKSPGKLRLVKVRVQPVFVLDGGGDNITELNHGVVEVPAAEWSTYSSERFPREVKQWQKAIDESTNKQSSIASNGSV